MVAPEELGRFVHGSLERLGLEALDVEAVVDRHSAAGDFQGAGLVVRDQEHGLAIPKRTARRDAGRRQGAGLRGVRGRPDEPREQTAELGTMGARQEPQKRLTLRLAQRRQGRRQRSSGLVALHRPFRESFEGRREAGALESWRARGWSRATHAPPLPRVPRESNHGSGLQPSLTAGATGV